MSGRYEWARHRRRAGFLSAYREQIEPGVCGCFQLAYR